MPPLPLTSPTRPRSTRPVLIALAALLAACGAARAGDVGAARDGDTDRPYWRTNLFGRVLTDQRFLVETWWPQEFRRPSFAAPVLAATIAALRSADDNETDGVDFSVLHAIEPGPSSDTRRSARTLTDLGDGAVVAAALGITYFGARRAGSDSLAGTSSLAAESLLDAGIYVSILKLAFARVRPGQPGQGRFFQYGKPQATSFPSGHAFGAFSVASVFAERYREERWVPWVVYSGAALVAASRAALGRHFPTDLVVGSLLGNSIGHAVIARSEQSEPKRSAFWRHVIPIAEPGRGGGIGIGLDLSR